MLVRIGDRDPQLWNIAADYAVNQILKDSNIGDMPKRTRKVENKGLPGRQVQGLGIRKNI